MQHFDSIAILRNSEYTGTLYVSGYFQPGDGGGGYYIWDSACAREDNGGTVIASNVIAGGRWLLQHGGRADFSTLVLWMIQRQLMMHSTLWSMICLLCA